MLLVRLRSRYFRANNFRSRKKASEKKLDYLLIDDGWCIWGDWLYPDHLKFPCGIKKVAEKLDHIKLKTGLWLSPFLIDPKSQLFKNHPDWIIRDSREKPVNGWLVTPLDHLFGYKKYILNFEIPEARNYIYSSIDTIIKNWGVKMLKLDFLYAPYFNPIYHSTHKPHDILQNLFRHIKINHPDIYVIVCGCPYQPAKYLVDAIRISKDITIPAFAKHPLIHHLVYHYRLRSMKQSFALLKSYENYFRLDPDVIISHSDESWYDRYAQIKLVGYRL